MLVLPQVPGGYTVFCDDIREEVEGKRTYVGIYRDVVRILGDKPAILTKICTSTTIRFQRELLDVQPELKIIFEDEEFVEKDIAVAKFDPPVPSEPEGISNVFRDKDGVSFLQVILEGQLKNLQIEKNGRIKVRLIAGDKEIALGTLLIRFDESVTS